MPALEPLPPDAVTLADHERIAQTRLSPQAWAYFNGGAADEISLRANRAAWDRLNLWPRVLRPVAGGHTRTELLGRTLRHPILVAPVAYQRLAHADGELATAYAAAAQGAGLVLSTQSSVPMEAVARPFHDEALRGPLWFQLYWQHDRGFVRELVQRAEAAGYEALVLTVDAPTSGVRDQERRTGFMLPPGISAVHLEGLPPRPAVARSRERSALFDDLLLQAPVWADLDWLQAQTRLPVLLKGIVHPDDAREAASLGMAAVVVSNHGGRVLDTVPATADCLPRVVEAVGGRLPVLVDGGIRRGTDVFKAVALGAQAVLVGRPCIHGLANAGAAGVAHVLRLLRDELEIAMALCGCATLSQAGAHHLAPLR